MDKIDHEPAPVPNLLASAQVGTSAADPPAPAEPAQEVDAANKAWDSAIEQEWSEHSATAWALAHVIHHIRSTPLPPFLSPEQRRHFQHIIQMAAALIEDWQRRERDQAQHLALARPVSGLPTDEPFPADEQAAASQDALPKDS